MLRFCVPSGRPVTKLETKANRADCFPFALGVQLTRLRLEVAREPAESRVNANGFQNVAFKLTQLLWRVLLVGIVASYFKRDAVFVNRRGQSGNR